MAFTSWIFQQCCSPTKKEVSTQVKILCNETVISKYCRLFEMHNYLKITNYNRLSNFFFFFYITEINIQFLKQFLT